MREEVAKVNSLQIFQHNGWTVRVIEINGEPWFVARDVCEALEHSDTSKAVSRLDDDEKLIRTLFVSGQNREVLLINEPGLYALVLTSRKPEAKAFKRWVTHEVIPSIRKTGAYSVVPQSPAELLLEMAKQFVEHERRMNRLEMQLQVASHRIDNLDNVDVIGDPQQRLNAMIRKYARQNGITFNQAWREFRSAYNTAYHTNITALRDNYKARFGLRELTIPEYLARTGKLEDAIRVADKMLNLVGV
jgi:prophage antirepressor-like protein